jgi:hypothetical protein
MQFIFKHLHLDMAEFLTNTQKLDLVHRKFVEIVENVHESLTWEQSSIDIKLQNSIYLERVFVLETIIQQIYGPFASSLDKEIGCFYTPGPTERRVNGRKRL